MWADICQKILHRNKLIARENAAVTLESFGETSALARSPPLLPPSTPLQSTVCFAFLQSFICPVPKPASRQLCTFLFVSFKSSLSTILLEFGGDLPTLYFFTFFLPQLSTGMIPKTKWAILWHHLNVPGTHQYQTPIFVWGVDQLRGSQYIWQWNVTLVLVLEPVPDVPGGGADGGPGACWWSWSLVPGAWCLVCLVGNTEAGIRRRSFSTRSPTENSQYLHKICLFFRDPEQLIELFWAAHWQWQFLSDPGVPGPIYGSSSLSLTK